MSHTATVEPLPSTSPSADEAAFAVLDRVRVGLCAQQAFETLLFPDDPRRRNLEPDPDKERRRVVRLRRQVDELRATIVERHVHLVMDLAVLWAEGEWDLSVELEEEGRRALLMAVDTFDHTAGVPFERWARLHVVRAALRVITPATPTAVDTQVVAAVRGARDLALMGLHVNDPLGEQVLRACAGAVPGVSPRTVNRILACDLVAQERDLHDRCERTPENGMVLRFAMRQAIDAQLATLPAGDADLIVAHAGFGDEDWVALDVLAARLGADVGEINVRYRQVVAHMMARIPLLSEA